MRLTQFDYVTENNNKPHGRIMLIGMLEDGPVAQTFTLKNPERDIAFLGDNEMTRSYIHLFNQGIPSENIILYRLNGANARAKLLNGNNEPVMELMSLSGHECDNDIRVTISEEGISIASNYDAVIVDSGLRKSFLRTYLFSEYPSVHELADAVVQDASLGLINVVAQSLIVADSATAFVPNTETFLSNGTSDSSMCIVDGAFHENYLNAYWPYFNNRVLGLNYDGTSYEHVAEISCELIYLPDLPVDMAKDIGLLTGYLAHQKAEQQGYPCFAVLRTSLVPKKRALGIDDYLTSNGHYYDGDTGEEKLFEPYTDIDAFVGKMTGLFTEEERTLLPCMKYMQVIVGEDASLNGVMPAATYYASLFLTSQVIVSLMNKELLSFTEIRSQLSKTHIATLSANGYICIEPSVRRHVVLSKINTMIANNEYIGDNFYHLRIIGLIYYDIGQMLDNYIGRTFEMTTYESENCQAYLNDYLKQYKNKNILADYKISALESMDYYDQYNIFLDLVFYDELSNLQATVSVDQKGWTYNLWELNA